MAYCVHCGKQVGDRDKFCPGCGSAQTAAAGSNPAEFWNNLSNRQAATLCYIPWVGWIAAVAVLAGARFKSEKQVQFHAFQGLYLFVAWMVVDWFLSPFFTFSVGFPAYHSFPNLFRVAILGAWIYMLIKVNQGQDARLPILGELADRSVAEQRS